MSIDLLSPETARDRSVPAVYQTRPNWTQEVAVREFFQESPEIGVLVRNPVLSPGQKTRQIAGGVLLLGAVLGMIFLGNWKIRESFFPSPANRGTVELPVEKPAGTFQHAEFAGLNNLLEKEDWLGALHAGERLAEKILAADDPGTYPETDRQALRELLVTYPLRVAAHHDWASAKRFYQQSLENGARFPGLGGTSTPDLLYGLILAHFYLQGGTNVAGVFSSNDEPVAENLGGLLDRIGTFRSTFPAEAGSAFRERLRLIEACTLIRRLNLDAKWRRAFDQNDPADQVRWGKLSTLLDDWEKEPEATKNPVFLSLRTWFWTAAHSFCRIPFYAEKVTIGTWSWSERDIERQLAIVKELRAGGGGR